MLLIPPRNLVSVHSKSSCSQNNQKHMFKFSFHTYTVKTRMFCPFLPSLEKYLDKGYARRVLILLSSFRKRSARSVLLQFIYRKEQAPRIY